MSAAMRKLVESDLLSLERYSRERDQFFIHNKAHYEDVMRLFGEGDRVAVRVRGEATHSAMIMGIPPTGKLIDISSITIFRCADGKIAEEWDQTDFLSMMQQLGVIPAPR